MKIISKISQNLKVDNQYSMVKSFSKEDIKNFQILSTDMNKIHYDEEYGTLN